MWFGPLIIFPVRYFSPIKRDKLPSWAFSHKYFCKDVTLSLFLCVSPPSLQADGVGESCSHFDLGLWGRLSLWAALSHPLMSGCKGSIRSDSSTRQTRLPDCRCSHTAVHVVTEQQRRQRWLSLYYPSGEKTWYHFCPGAMWHESQRWLWSARGVWGQVSVHGWLVHGWLVILEGILMTALSGQTCFHFPKWHSLL